MNLLAYYKNQGIENPLEIYIHIPFCEKKCDYCDFLSFPNKEEYYDIYIKTLLEEIKVKSIYYSSYNVVSIFIGGGTPSVLDEKYINLILTTIRINYNLINNIEISIECNPHSAIEEKLYAYKEYGINRLSIGLQTSNNTELELIGRLHSYEQFLLTMQLALRAKFTNINIDIISGLPCQTVSSFKKTLQQVIMLRPTHISCYNLILEEHTPLYYRIHLGELNLPSEDEIIAMDIETKNMLSKHSYHKYEISNYAKNGFECKHNLGYWSDIYYLGFGLGASSYVGNKRWTNKTDLDEYLNLSYSTYGIMNNEDAFYDNIIELNTKQLMDEFLMLGFRKTEGVNCEQFKNKFNKEIREVYTTALDQYLTDSLIAHINGHYCFTERGMNISNKILSDLLFN